MKRVYICSPFRGNTSYNAGVAPFASHILYTQFLDDASEADRKAGMQAATEFLRQCNEVWVYNGSLKITAGMSAEIGLAKSLGKPVLYPWPDEVRPIPSLITSDIR